MADGPAISSLIAANPDRLICNHNLFDVAADELTGAERSALVAVLNSTIVGLFKTFYGRYAGTEGNLKTEVVDVNLLELPDPRGVSRELATKLNQALKRMSHRDVGRLVEEQLMDCHSPELARRIADGPLVLSDELRQADRRELDDAVFELLGVTGPRERSELIDRLHDATARHFREIRVIELEKNRQKAKSNSQRFAVQDLAADIWDAAELADAVPVREWLERRPDALCELDIPHERPVRAPDNPLFEPNTVYFGRTRSSFVECQSPDQARLVTELANLGLTDLVKMPIEPRACQQALAQLAERLNTARTRFRELAESRTGDERVQRELMEVLERWFVLGREGRRETACDSADEN